MSRPLGGAEFVSEAMEVINSASTLEQLRQAQAVVLPLQPGMDLGKAAEVIGLSKGWVCRLRNQFISGNRIGTQGKSVRGGRRREYFTQEQEVELLEPFLKSARTGGILIVNQIKPAIEMALGKEVALSTVYKLLHRHNWRKLAPDKTHPKSDPEAQLDWKKNSRKRSSKSARTGPKAHRSG